MTTEKTIMENNNDFKVHKLIRYPLLIILAFVGSRIAFITYNLYWRITYAVWNPSVLMSILQTSISVALGLFISINIAKITIGQKKVRVQDFLFSSLEPNSFKEWLFLSVLLTLVSIILFVVALNLVTLAGLVMML